MSLLPKHPKSLVILLSLLGIVGAWAIPGAHAEAEFIAVLRSLPDIQVRSLATGEDVRLAGALAGRPAILLLTDGSGSAECPVGRAAASLQTEYGPWFSWVAVLSGAFSPADLESVRSSSPVRFERLYLDRAGALRTALAIARLPALLLLDEDGAIHDVCAPDGSASRFDALARRLQLLAAKSRRRRSEFEDFRIPRVGGESLASFLDVAGRESTLFSFIHTGCLPCARQLEVLEFARDRRAGQVTLVTVFLDDKPDARIRGFLGAAGVTPDHILRDAELRFAGRYGIDAVPALLVIGVDGRVVLSRSGYRDEAREELYRDLELALATGAIAAEAVDPALREAHRIHTEACEFLREGKPEFAMIYQQRIREMFPEFHSVNLRIAEAALAAGRRDVAISSLARYLAAQPQTYDSSRVRETIAGLLEANP